MEHLVRDLFCVNGVRTIDSRTYFLALDRLSTRNLRVMLVGFISSLTILVNRHAMGIINEKV